MTSPLQSWFAENWGAIWTLSWTRHAVCGTHAGMMPRPIFIVGSGRSGTSALTWAIGQHPNIHVVAEMNWLSALASYMDGLHRIGSVNPTSHLPQFNVEFPAFAEGLGHGADRLVRDSFRRRFPAALKPKNGASYLRAENDPKQRWVDGTPSNTPYAAIIAQMFPEAKFLHLIRRPQDVFRSWAGFSSRSPSHKQPKDLLEFIYHSQRAGYLAEAAFGADRIARIFFADMVQRPESTLRRISRFIGEEYSPHMIEPLASKINSSGETKPEVLAELDAIKNSDRMTEMLAWYEQASDSTWQILMPDGAGTELAKYAKWRIPLPA